MIKMIHILETALEMTKVPNYVKVLSYNRNGCTIRY